jgi:cephalosporin-C deacetylase-like acetyl esterase
VDTHFKAALYINGYYKCSVLAIRGTVLSEIPTIIVDAFFGLESEYFIMDVYRQALSFYQRISSSAIVKEYPLVACTGHSLGGIIAKMIAPVTGFVTEN